MKGLKNFRYTHVLHVISACVWSLLFTSLPQQPPTQPFPVTLSVVGTLRPDTVMEPLKLVVVGPLAAGKTTIANYVADATEISDDYRPTKGVRILEFEVPNVRVKNKSVKVDVELWDCSGDRKYEAYWPAFRKDVFGVIFVCGQKSEDDTRYLEKLYDYFVTQPNLEPRSCVVFHYNSEKARNSGFSKNSLPSSFARLSQVSCNVEEGGGKLKSDFQSFISTLTAKKQEKSEHEESTIISESGAIFSSSLRFAGRRI